MAYRDDNSNLKSHIATLRLILAFQALLMLGLWHGWREARQDLTVHIPPDLRSGATLKVGEIHPANVYAFTAYIFQQLNRWKSNGEKDYSDRIYALQSFFTPAFRRYLIDDLEQRGKSGQLTNRVRALTLAPGQGFDDRRVDILAPGVWRVWLDVHIEEHTKGMAIKSVDIRYPIRVVRYNVDPENNPWGLALDGYDHDHIHKLTEQQEAL